MITRAPGKVVLSGAYSVLEGSRAVVTAVDRYVLADASRVAQWVTPEVSAAHLRTRPWFDASALRQADRKLGLGSSAAILVASIAADALEAGEAGNADLLATKVVRLALHAHAAVQPLGSGIDVVASCFGGTLTMQRVASEVSHRYVELPHELHIEIWSAPVSQSTHDMLEKLGDFRRRQPGSYSRLVTAQADASELAAEAFEHQQAAPLVAALARQRDALDALGREAGIPIVTDEVRTLADSAAKESAAVLPAGAGGGDIAVFVGPSAPSVTLREKMVKMRHERLNLALGARGVHAASKEC
jgi:phosphomevalonate kinase